MSDENELTPQDTSQDIPQDTPSPQSEDSRFISSTDYYTKYRHFFDIAFTARYLARACLEWNSDETIPDKKRIGLISEKRLVPDLYIKPKSGTNMKRMRWQWFIFDIPPAEHPGWSAYLARFLVCITRSGKAIAKDFKRLTPIYLERFDEASKNLDETQFRISELSRMVHTTTNVIRSWTLVGVKGFGKLPSIKAVDAVKPVKEGASLYVTRLNAGRLDFFYARKDIRRFLKGELADPKKKFKTIDDVMNPTKTDVQDIAEKTGYFIYHTEKAYPLTFEGFMEWANKNIVFYDRRSRRMTPFRPSPKQEEFYRNVFKLKEHGILEHVFNYTCRPRGDYKTFDIAVIVLFRFFNLARERIYLVTNSVQQTTHLVYREAYDIIRTSPILSLMLSTPGLDVSTDGIYLRSGRGVENIFSSIEIVSAAGGARSNATCIAWSEAWKFKGKETDVAELMQSIRGVDNAIFLAESTVAPKGHWFERQYEISIGNEPDPLSYFQYYDGTQRQNPKITPEFLASAKKSFPIHYKAFFDNKWEDATTGLFPEKRIIEMGVIGIDGGTGRNTELLTAIDRITDLNVEIRKYDNAMDMTKQKTELKQLESRLNYLNYKIPIGIDTLEHFSRIYDCEWIIGLGLDRAKQMTDRADRTVLAAVARGILDAKRWGTDRLFLLLDLRMLKREDDITEHINEIAQLFGGIGVCIDLEDWNVLEIHKKCEDFGYEPKVVPVSYKHQKKIFEELYLASDEGYLKCPQLDIWFDSEDKVHEEDIPTGISDILRTEMASFEHQEGISEGGGGGRGWFGSKHKRVTKRVPQGMARDDTIYALAHAMNASIRGDIPAMIKKISFANAVINEDVIGDYRH